MRLTIRIMDAASVPGGKSLIVCDEQGKALPNQLGVTVATAVGENSTVTVTFAADGEKVKFA